MPFRMLAALAKYQSSVPKVTSSGLKLPVIPVAGDLTHSLGL